MTTLTPGTILYSADGWRISVYRAGDLSVVVNFLRRNSQRKLLDRWSDWDPHHRCWLGYRWRPVGRVPDAVLREVERKLQQDQPTTTETTP